MSALPDEDPLGDRPIAAAFPPDGALRLWGDVPVTVALGGAAHPSELEVHVTRGGATTWFPCALERGGTSARCGVLPDVEPGEDLSLQVRVGDEIVRHDTSGRLPVPGLGWSLLEGVVFTVVGADPHAADTVNGFLSEGLVFAALDGFDGTPGRWPFVVSPAGLDEDGDIAIAPWGFGFVLQLWIDGDGVVSGGASTGWLSVLIGADPVLLLLLDLELSARLDGDRLQLLVLNAALPGSSIAELADAAGVFKSQVLGAIQLDLDRDGDGEPDAATLRLEGEPTPATLRAWDDR